MVVTLTTNATTMVMVTIALMMMMGRRKIYFLYGGDRNEARPLLVIILMTTMARWVTAIGAMMMRRVMKVMTGMMALVHALATVYSNQKIGPRVGRHQPAPNLESRQDSSIT